MTLELDEPSGQLESRVRNAMHALAEVYEPGLPVAPSSESRAGWILGLAAGVLVLAGAAVLLLTSGSSDDTILNVSTSAPISTEAESAPTLATTSTVEPVPSTVSSDDLARLLPALNPTDDAGPVLAVGTLTLLVTRSVEPDGDTLICAVEMREVEVGRACGDPNVVNGLISFQSYVSDDDTAAVLLVDPTVQVTFSSTDCTAADADKRSNLALHSCVAAGGTVTAEVQPPSGSKYLITFNIYSPDDFGAPIAT